MTDKYLLVKVYDDWADEISTEGFFTTTQEELDETYEAIKEYFKENNSLTYYIGTNEEITHESYEDVVGCFRTQEITKQEYTTLKKLFHGSFGIVNILDQI